MEKLHLAIIGVGLIGGSFGLAVKEKLGDKVHITGLCRSRTSQEAALSCGAVDEASVEVADVVKTPMWCTSVRRCSKWSPWWKRCAPF